MTSRTNNRTLPTNCGKKKKSTTPFFSFSTTTDKNKRNNKETVTHQPYELLSNDENTRTAASSNKNIRGHTQFQSTE